LQTDYILELAAERTLAAQKKGVEFAQGAICFFSALS
jgi:hypothetical protein